MDKKQKTAICVFCGSSYGDNPLYREVARAMGAGIAKAGWSLVFGGGGNGLMGDVARAAGKTERRRWLGRELRRPGGGSGHARHHSGARLRVTCRDGR